MPHIDLGNDLPGLLGLLAYRQDTARPLLELVQTLMEGPSTLTRGERELIGSLVSKASDCQFCRDAHGAFAASTIDGGEDTVRDAQQAPCATGLSPRIQALIDIALAVTDGGHQVTPQLVEHARSVDATDREVHDVVLLASAFALFTRYVDGLATVAPGDPAWYQGMAHHLSLGGYGGMAALLAQQAPEPVAV